MTLSNTAVPYYYGKFRDAVLRGTIPIPRTIALEMKRIDALIASPRYYYDDKAIEGFVAFCENELVLTDGRPLTLLDTFALWAEQLFGWYYFIERRVYEPGVDGARGHYVKKRIKKRLTQRQYLIIGRGAAKSMYATCIQAFYLVVDGATTEQIVVAPTMRQADETMAPLRTAIVKSRGPVFKFLTQGSIFNTTGSSFTKPKLAVTKDGIVNRMTNSILKVEPMSVDKLQGRRCKVATIDEWLSGDTRDDVVGAIVQSAAKDDQDYIIVCTSSEGVVRNGIGDQMKMELMSILEGEYNNPHVSIWYYRLDNEKEVGDPELWIKANPNLDKTVTYEAYQLDVERMERVPSTRNDTLAKRFGIPSEGYTLYFTYEETQCSPYSTYESMACSLGCDLSRGDDFCAFTFLFPLYVEPSQADEITREMLENSRSAVKYKKDADGYDMDPHSDSSKSVRLFGVKTRNYISSATYYELPIDIKEKYDTFIAEGSLVVMDGAILNMDDVYFDLDDYIIENQFDVRCVGYDPYNVDAWLKQWIAHNGEYGLEVIRQGVKTESVPLGELKILAHFKCLRFDQECMKFAMGNCMVALDTNGNRKLYKRRKSEKIDPVAALMDAYIAYWRNAREFD